MSTREVDVETTLLMLVTNRDCVIANYSIHAYRKLWRLYKRFRLRVYANNLSALNQRRFLPRWRKYPYVLVVTSADAPGARRNGELFKTPEGIQMRYEDDCEHQEQIWAREQQACDTRFFGTVDADFEILTADFIIEMLRRLRADEALAACSTDYTPTVEAYFDSYSQTTMTLAERWHTWCCIYNQDVKEYMAEVSPSYFEEFLPDGTKYAFDSYAHFQAHLRTRYGRRFDALGPTYGGQYVHYGAFSKNRSLGRFTVLPYRLLTIAAGPGVSRSTRWPWGRVNTVGRRVAARLFSRYCDDLARERATWLE